MYVCVSISLSIYIMHTYTQMYTHTCMHVLHTHKHARACAHTHTHSYSCTHYTEQIYDNMTLLVYRKCFVFAQSISLKHVTTLNILHQFETGNLLACTSPHRHWVMMA